LVHCFPHRGSTLPFDFAFHPFNIVSTMVDEAKAVTLLSAEADGDQEMQGWSTVVVAATATAAAPATMLIHSAESIAPEACPKIDDALGEVECKCLLWVRNIFPKKLHTCTDATSSTQEEVWSNKMQTMQPADSPSITCVDVDDLSVKTTLAPSATNEVVEDGENSTIMDAAPSLHDKPALVKPT
jgi:hypothetical protein